MQTESKLSLDFEAHPPSENIIIQDENPGIKSSASNNIVPQQPAKKTTRQWAAWTRQEEESFFTALRQVGKNFEKITCRVQSKNKDQVRHYYYRLVRRMNKLLGPELCLDAKNSKDTNAAMLRWWSLLEKYSCKASKLHLKPRRFKIFIEALENQLLKDRKKNVRTRPSQGENCSPTASSTISIQSRASGHDTRTLKLVLVDSRNIQKLGPVKGSLKRNVNVGVNRSNNKVDLNTMKPARQRRKQGAIPSAAYKKWEKAAIAGVSLVADAAEHLERTATDKEVEQDQGQKDLDQVGKVLPHLLSFSPNNFVESNIHTCMKLKLQLFPIDDGTRRVLEMDKHNPHLELTLSTRKKISSVMEHLNRKWGSSSVASGELMLFPYSVQRESLVGYQRWTQDSVSSAADVYAMIGSPPVFRLRYGWFNDTELGSITLQAPLASSRIPGDQNPDVANREPIVESPISVPLTNEKSKERVDPHQERADPDKDDLTSVSGNHALARPSTDVSHKMSSCTGAGQNNNVVEFSDPVANISWQRKEAGDQTIMRQLDDADDLRLSNDTALSAGEWADSLTNVSVGDLLSEVSHHMDSNCIDPPVHSSQCLQQIPFSCDSFDAAIAAHISRHQNKMGVQSALASHAPSIWDAEETCDAFSFQNNPVLCQEVLSYPSTAPPGACKQINGAISVGSGVLIKDLPAAEGHADNPDHVDPMDQCQPDPNILDISEKAYSGLTDIYWPDSLGQLDLDIPSCKYHSEDLILSDSLSGLNRLIASSLDAFQNLSFFGLDKKEAASTVEARETAPSDFKIGSGV